jgi:Mg2+ and Co2+ transporter CorA
VHAGTLGRLGGIAHARGKNSGGPECPLAAAGSREPDHPWLCRLPGLRDAPAVGAAPPSETARLLYRAAMDVIEGAVPANQHPTEPSRAPVVVLREPDPGEGVSEAARWLGADPDLAHNLRRHPHRRPSAHVEGDRIAAVTFAASGRDLPSEMHLHVGERGLLVVASLELHDLVRPAVAPVHGDPQDAFAAMILALAHLSEEVIEHLAELALGLDQASSGLASGAQRREVSRARAQLFALQLLWAAHRQMLADDEPLATAVADRPRRVLRRARTIFDASSTTAALLYALLGDTLNRQSTVIDERLTLVAIVGFPLTVSTGFFGMNFGWLVENIGSLAAFLVFGILVPLALVGVTVVGARWLTRE